MKPVSDALFTRWESKAKAGEHGIISIVRGHKVNLLALCHATSSSRNGEILYPARECVEPHHGAVYAVAIRSLSIVDRVLQVTGLSDPPNIRFHSDYEEEDFKFDAECKIPRKPGMVKSMCGELVCAIKGSVFVIEDDTNIVSEVRLVQGSDTLLLESAILRL